MKKLSRGAVFLDFVTMYVYACSVRSVIPVNIDVKVCMSFDKNQALYLRVGFQASPLLGKAFKNRISIRTRASIDQFLGKSRSDNDN